MARVEKFGAVGFGISKSEFMGVNIFFTKVFYFDKRKKSDAEKFSPSNSYSWLYI